MKIGGMGDEVLRVPLVDIRRLSELPRDVEVLRIVTPPPGTPYPADWVPYPREVDQPQLFLHVRHRYCTRCPPGSVMMVGTLDGFLERYRGVAAMEVEYAGKPVDEHTNSPWVDETAA